MRKDRSINHRQVFYNGRTEYTIFPSLPPCLSFFLYLGQSVGDAKGGDEGHLGGRGVDEPEQQPTVQLRGRRKRGREGGEERSW